MDAPLNRPRLLDLFCGAGGAGMGYHLAGFDVTGVDIRPQPRYPFAFVQADALEYVAAHGHEYDAIHASPPCQAFTRLQPVRGNEHPDLIASTRRALGATGRLYAIENVPGAPLENPLMLCGTMFGLTLIRHRLFECNPVIWFPPMSCRHWGHPGAAGRLTDPNGFVSVAGRGGRTGVKGAWQRAMGIDWMTVVELAQAIPPAFTRYIGGFLLHAVRGDLQEAA